MRFLHPHDSILSRSFRHSALASTALAALLLGGTMQPAQAQFTGLYGFGDSYADTGAAPGGAFQLAGRPCIYPNTCSFTGSTTFVQSLQTIYRLPTMTNYAIGGARTDNTNTLVAVPTFAGPITPIVPPLPGLPYEMQQLAASGTRFRDTDLIALSIGGNDLSGIAIGTAADPNAVIVAGAKNSAVNAAGAVQQMAGAGARTIAWLGTGSSKWFPERTLGVGGVNFSDPQRNLWADTYYQQTQQLLAPLAQSGVRIFLFNFGILQQRVHDDPGLYGFVSATLCEAGPASPTTPSNVTAGLAGCFYENSVHPTGAAMALIATYMANQVDAPTTVVPQGAITTSIAAGFANALFGRLEASRSLQPFGLGHALASIGPIKAPPRPAAPDDRWSVYGDASYAAASIDRQFYGAGYDYHAVGGHLGIEYQLDSNWRLGGALGYSEPEANLGVQNAHDRIKSVQLAGYASYTERNWFADGLISYGRHDFTLDRQGVIDVIRASTSADTFTAAARGGYLVDVGAFRVGPVAGLTYTHATIDGYAESGDALLTMRVDRQTLDALTGSIGAQLRLPVALGTAQVSPFVSVTAEHDFGDARSVVTTLASAPLLPILTPISGQDRSYGKVAAGISANIAGQLSATLTGSSSFARDGGDLYGVSGGLKLAF